MTDRRRTNRPPNRLTDEHEGSKATPPKKGILRILDISQWQPEHAEDMHAASHPILQHDRLTRPHQIFA